MRDDEKIERLRRCAMNCLGPLSALEQEIVKSRVYATPAVAAVGVQVATLRFMLSYLKDGYGGPYEPVRFQGESAP